MSLQRKQIILNEIAFWKKNKLIPEQYCDFLTALYANGETEEAEEKDKSSKALLSKEKRNKIILYVLLGIVTAILIASLILIQTIVLIPIVASSIAIFIFLYIARKLVKSKTVMTSLLFIFSALLLLGISFKLWDVYFIDYPFVLIGLIIANCILWLFSGFFLKLVYFSISGAVGIVFILFYIFGFYL